MIIFKYIKEISLCTQKIFQGYKRDMFLYIRLQLLKEGEKIMQIDDNGFEMTDLDKLLSDYKNELKTLYGNDFTIKPEGVIDNIAVSNSYLNMKLEGQIAFLLKQFDPETAEGEWQDALYERIGLSRKRAAKTAFICNVKGTPALVCPPASLVIRSKTDNSEFENIDEFTITEDGTALVEFQCVVEGAVEVKNSDEFELISAPSGITAVTCGEDIHLILGQDEESDAEFRARFHNSKNYTVKATRNANLSNLSKYVDNIAFLKIIDKKSDNSFEPGDIKIIAHHNTTDEVFAKAIFDTVADGVKYLGDTAVTVYDSYEQPVVIRFQNASEIEVDIMADVKVRSGYYPNTVFNKAKENVLKYIKERVFGLESTIYATEFIVPILETDGVEAVQNIKVKRSDTDVEYLDNVSLTREQIPIFAAERIILNEDK